MSAAIRSSWPTAAERLQEPGAARVALGDAHPDAGLEQRFADVAADESAAAENRDQARVRLSYMAGSLCPRGKAH